MKYYNIINGVFLDRPNRFVSNVLIDGKLEKAHVKNTGRCKEILKKGTIVYLEKSNNPNRKTNYSIISAYKDNILINIDSQIPNYVVYDSICSNKIFQLKEIDYLKREVTYGNSRFDLYYEKGKQKGFIEVKGVTLEIDGISTFPDAPTKRGVKHIFELIESQREGFQNYVFFLIQIDGIRYFRPNVAMDIDFSNSLILAKKEGVNILAYNSIITRDTIDIGENVEILIWLNLMHGYVE